MRRRVRVALAISLATAIGAAAGVVVYRLPILETLVTTALQAKGIPAPRMTVTDIDWGSIGITKLSLGTAGEVTVRSVLLDYSLSGLMAGRLDWVAMDGLVIALDATGDAPLLGSLQPLLSSSDSSRGGSSPLPPLSLTDLRIDVQTTAGTVSAIGDAQVQTSSDGETAVELSLNEITFNGTAIASGQFSVTLPTVKATGTIDFALTGVSVPDRVAGLDAHARLAIDAAEDIVTLRLREDATLAATQVSPAFLQSLGIPPAISNQIEHGFAARLQAPGADGPVAIAARDGGAVAVALNGTLHVTVPGLADLSLALPADIRAERDRLRVQLRAPSDVRLTKFRYGGIAELLAPTVVTVAEADVTIAPVLAYRVVLSGPAFRLQSQDVEAIVTPGRITLTADRAEISEAQIEIPAYGVVAGGLSATLDATNSETRIGFHIASVRQTGSEAMIAPIKVTGQATRTDDVWRGTATGEGPGGVGRIVASGSHDGATARGQARIALEPLVFVPGGAQPGTLLPALSALQTASGTTTGEADLSWSAKGFQGTGSLVLTDIGFDSPQVRVEGLDLRLHLDSLTPLASPPRQTLTIRRLDAGLPLDRLDIRFQIRPTEPPSVAIETGEVFLGSGRFALSDLVVDPAATRQDVDLRVQDLNLAELFAILNIDGLDGDGQLSGTIPMTFSDGIVVIENGRLSASAPGTIRFRSEKAAQILAGQGESLDLVLRALEDFRYDELTIDLEKSSDDVGRMKLSLLGKNPAVLEGYPFRFNISIEADTAKLVTALTTIYQVPNDFLRRAWTYGR